MKTKVWVLYFALGYEGYDEPEYVWDSKPSKEDLIHVIKGAERVEITRKQEPCRGMATSI